MRPALPRGEAAQRAAERSAALFLLGLLAFNPPLLDLFAGPLMVWGIPLLYLWIFGVWAVLILLVGLNARRLGG